MGLSAGAISNDARWRKSDTKTQQQRQNVQWALVDQCEGAVDLIIVMTSTHLSANLLVDEVDGLRFELVGAVQVSQDEDLGGIFHRQAGTQRVLTHDLQSLQSVLGKTDGAKHQHPQVFHVVVAKCHLGVDEEACIFFLKG